MRVRFADTAELAGTLLEEGARTRADVFVAQDAAALERLRDEGLLQPHDGLMHVPRAYRAADATWAGLSGRARVLMVRRGGERPESVFDLADPRWRGRVAAPNTSNVSFRDWVSTIRIVRGERFARYLPRGAPAERARGAGEPRRGPPGGRRGRVRRRAGEPLLRRARAARGLGRSRRSTPTRSRAGFGVLFNVASAGIPRSAEHPEAARRLLDYLTSPERAGALRLGELRVPAAGRAAAGARGPPLLDRFETADVPLERARPGRRGHRPAARGGRPGRLMAARPDLPPGPAPPRAVDVGRGRRRRRARLGAAPLRGGEGRRRGSGHVVGPHRPPHSRAAAEHPGAHRGRRAWPRWWSAPASPSSSCARTYPGAAPCPRCVRSRSPCPRTWAPWRTATCSARGADLRDVLGVEALPSIFGFWGAALVLTVFTYPYVFLLAVAALRNLNPSYEEAAQALGQRAVRGVRGHYGEARSRPRSSAGPCSWACTCCPTSAPSR